MKTIILLLVIGFLAMPNFAQEIPSDVKRVYDKIEKNKSDLNKITDQDIDQSSIKVEVEGFQSRMNTLQNYVNTLKKRYAKKDYSLADLESKHQEFIAYYESVKDKYKGVAGKTPSGVVDLKKDINEGDEYLTELISGKYEKIQIELRLKSFPKNIAKLKSRHSNIKADLEKRKVDYDLDEVLKELTSLEERYTQVKADFDAGNLDIEAKQKEIKQLNEVKNQLMVYCGKWDYRAELLQPSELRKITNNLIKPYNWNELPAKISQIKESDVNAKTTYKYLNKLKDNIKNKDDFKNFLSGMMKHAYKVKENDGYPSKESTQKANAIAKNVVDVIDFANTICGNVIKLSTIKKDAQGF